MTYCNGIIIYWLYTVWYTVTGRLLLPNQMSTFMLEAGYSGRLRHSVFFYGNYIAYFLITNQIAQKFVFKLRLLRLPKQVYNLFQKPYTIYATGDWLMCLLRQFEMNNKKRTGLVTTAKGRRNGRFIPDFICFCFV